VRRPLDVGVIGCGTAGAAAAVFLARAGHVVALYERVPEPGPVGAGIVLQPSGQHVLERLGLLEEIVARGARLDGLECVTDDGKKIVDLEYATLDPRLFGVGLHRGVLFAALFGAVQREPIALRLGVGIDSWRRDRSGRIVCTDESGARHGPHDLLVVCDGARSHLRAGPGVPSTAHPYPWGALWFVGRDPDARFTRKLRQTVRGTRRMLGLLPTGRGPDEADPVPHVSLYWSIRLDEVAPWRAKGLAAWKSEILRFRPDASPVLDQIEDASQVLTASYHDVVMRRWHAHDVVCLGDAAHATSPQLGQGCNLALWDAMTLASCLESHPTVEAALGAYSAAREDHLAFYQFATRWLTPLFQSDLAPLGPLRDMAMGAMTKVPMFQRQMVETMAGIKLGVIARPLDLANVNPPDPE